VVISSMAFVACIQPTRVSASFDLKVLYGGDLKSERTADFRTFLEKYFAKVDVADYLLLKEADTKGYDVIILDWPGLPPRTTDFKGFKGPEFGPNYDRPTILIGGGTLAVGRQFQLKLDDLCICLGDAAHGIQASHTIFHEPLEVQPTFEVRPTPSNYKGWPEEESLGETMNVWKVQTKGYSLANPTDLSVMPGMVADPYGFADSPDTELISSGLNMKSPKAVAIGRQGNFLLWGFYAQPADLTPEARKCFVNAVCYIKKFDGKKPLVRKDRGRLSRDWVTVLAHRYRYDADLKRFLASQPEELRSKSAEQHRIIMEGYRKLLSQGLREDLGNDPERYVAYYRENLEFLRQTEGQELSFTVDEDAKSLGLSNRKIELLDKCTKMLEQGDRPDLALRLLKRYTTESFTEAGQWRKWLGDARERLFFSDIGGYKFLVRPDHYLDSTAPKSADLTAEETEAARVVSAKLRVTPEKVRAGEEFSLVLRVKTAPTWHIYAMNSSKGPGIPTTINLGLPKGVESTGEWVLPKPIRDADGQLVYQGEFEFRRTFRVVAEVVPGVIKLTGELDLQACNPFSCQLPKKLVLEATTEVVKAEQKN